MDDEPGSKKIEYVPPKPDDIRAFARKVSEELAKRTNNPKYLQPQTVRWLAEFLELAARTQAKRLNDDGGIDSYEK